MRKYTPFPSFEVTYTLEVPKDSLLFESRFESGNLAKAIRTSPTTYSLYLAYDTETKGHTQWYYFSVANDCPGTYTFNIVNLLKYDSLYNEGLLPAVKSEKKGGSWHRDGFAVSYYENPRSREENMRTYTLSFTYTFQIARDTVYFAHCIPYTFADLCKYLEEVRTRTDIARVAPMCKSLAGNVCEVITITQNIETYRSHEEEVQEWAMSAAARRLNRQRQERQEKLALNLGKKHVNEHRHKQGLIFTARVHPGETPGSFMLKGVIDFLLSDCREARLLRKHFVVKIVPMLNPDGVRYGNYRCSALGVDLNRRWDSPSKLLHPTIYYAKKMAQAFAEWHHVVLFCDFHGHSCKRGIFAYGCSKRSTDIDDRKRSLLARMVPFLLSQRCPLFSFADCHFRMQKSKESTARMVTFKELGIVNSYTIEASFFGPKTLGSFMPARSDYHFLSEDYEVIGRKLCTLCLLFVSKAVFTRRLREVSNWLRGRNEAHQSPRLGKEWTVARSKSLQESLVQKVAAAGMSPGSVRNQPLSALRPSVSLHIRSDSDSSLSELESIAEGNEEDEVLSVALQENAIWEELLEQEELLASSAEDAESDSAPSDHGEPLRLPTPKTAKRRTAKRAKVCKTETSEEPEDKITRKSSHQSLRANHQRALRLPKSPRNTNGGSIVTFSFADDQVRGSVETKELALRRPGRLAELLRGPEHQETSPLEINCRAKLSERAHKVGMNHYSYLALQRQMEGEKQESPYAAGSSSRVISGHNFRRRLPFEARKPMEEFRRAPRTRKARETGMTIEEVLQLKEERKHSDCDLPGEPSLLGALPRLKEGLEQILKDHRGRRGFRLRVGERI